MADWQNIIKNSEPVTWEQIKKFYKHGRNEILSEDWKEAFCFAFSKSRDPYWIDLLATGYRARQLQEKQEFATAYSHGSEIQKIAAEYVKKRGTAENLAAYEENRFIDVYLFALKQLELKQP